MTTTERICRCGRPTDKFYCDDCAQSFSVALGEIPWVERELDITITRQQAATWNGGSHSPETALPFHPSASDARGNLRAVLVAWVRFCDEEAIRHQSPAHGLPTDTLTAMSRWLMWRVDGLALHDIGPEAVDEITSAVAHCRRLIDRPLDRQFLGRCEQCEKVGDEGRLYARPGSILATCNNCGDVIDAERLKTRLLAELDDRLCTAAEIAHLSTYLGLDANRDQVRKRINTWHRRRLITSESLFEGEAAFRFGIVWRLLAHNDGAKAG